MTRPEYSEPAGGRRDPIGPPEYHPIPSRRIVGPPPLTLAGVVSLLTLAAVLAVAAWAFDSFLAALAALATVAFLATWDRATRHPHRPERSTP